MRTTLRFNYLVRPSEVQSLLKVSQDGQQVAFDIAATEPDSTVSVTLTQSLRPGNPLQLEVAPGLRAVGSDQPTQKPLIAQAAVPSQETLLVHEATGALVEGEPVITVLTSQPVVASEVERLLTVQPAATYSVEALESGFKLKGNFDVDKTYHLGLGTGIRGLWADSWRRRFRSRFRLWMSGPVWRLPTATRLCTSMPWGRAIWGCGCRRWRK
ncbi:hypothetical protein H9L05_02990 [Hymenobacter qilianensis]|uniref:Uncharacterized protein n=1 Tax=Hymenobacter qilianensis TaxID=1385715 RepID=A0A7H0GWR3_9BACT|nr:hypothetical protein [Hymenobacter qilianensis]QNP52729.1 hypothetical protein H9L05_02990 [Hymenobacter qilianensis]